MPAPADTEPMTCMDCGTPYPGFDIPCQGTRFHGFLTRRPGQSNTEAVAAYRATYVRREEPPCPTA